MTNEDEEEEVKGDIILDINDNGNDNVHENVIEHGISTTDATTVMITKAHLRKLTPLIQAPSSTKCPTLTQFSFFDLSNDAHLAQLCNKLTKIEISDENRRPRLKHDHD